MKKFGTPIGAGPGSESENVGFDGVGTPLWFEDRWDFVFGLGLRFGLRGCGFCGLCRLGLWVGCLESAGRFAEGSCAFGGPLACGGPEDGAVVVELLEVEVDGRLVVEVEVEVDPGVEVVDVADDDEEDDEDEDEDEGAAVVVLLDVVVEEEEVESMVAETVLGVVAVTPGRQLSVSDAITPDTGNVKADIGVFGAASTTNVCVSPPTMVAVIVHESAAATGNPTTDIVAIIAPASALITNSFRLLDTTAYLLLPSRVRNPRAATGRRPKLTLQAASEVCKS